MIEPIMYLAIGFLVSMLLGLMIVPLVHNRAVRLTTKRLEAAAPLSMAEIQADKDQLRAEFAMSARRLEMSVDQLRHKTTTQLAELGKKADAINRLKQELAEKNAAIFTLEAREKSVHEQLRKTEEDFAAKTLALRAAEQELATKQAELAHINSELSERSLQANTREVELVAFHTQIEALKGRVEQAEKEFSASQQRLDQQRGESDAATRELAEARKQVATLDQRAADLDRQLAEQIKEAQSLGRRVAELETTVADQAAQLAARDAELAALRGASGATGSRSADVERLQRDKSALEQELAAARAETGRVQRELAAMQQQTESSWATERMENALLRERINDIAAEVARLAMTLEGPDSPIDAILANEPAAADQPKPAGVNGTHLNAAAVMPAGAAPELRGTLADRIRALQAHASRARTVA